MACPKPKVRAKTRSASSSMSRCSRQALRTIPARLSSVADPNNLSTRIAFERVPIISLRGSDRSSRQLVRSTKRTPMPSAA